MIRYGLTILLSAFLLFQIQPLVAKKLLPELGGSSTIWTTCMMFFQIALFVGYLYAHALRRLLNPSAGWIVHTVMIVISMVWLFLQPFHLAQPLAGELTWTVTQRLMSLVGLPFVVLAATSPLIQSWHSLSHPGQRTYRLYALSNAGSLLALVTYPFVFDPVLGISAQSIIWACTFVVFACSMVACGLQIRSSQNWFDEKNHDDEKTNGNFEFSATDVALWIALSATGSILLIATSNILCQEVASFPFLWVLPLICYLLTLIVCFDWPKLYRRWFFQPVFAASCFLAIVVYHFGINLGLSAQALGCSAVLLAGCMICHGELVRLRPDVKRLTYFYLAMSFGGALGGLFAVVVAPKMFSRFFEFHVSLIAVLVLSSLQFCHEHFRRQAVSARPLYVFLLVSGLAAVPVLSSVYFFLDPALNRGSLFQGRNDYGLIGVKETQHYRIMKSGSTNHGGQYLSDELKAQPFAYYSRGSGAEIAFSTIRKWQTEPGKPLRVGVIGLGTGSLLSHGLPDDQFRFYEINPMVEQVALKYFSYLPVPGAEVVIGDGRFQLSRELKELGSHQFDLLFLDAFSSDSIPVHLLTQECFDLYLKHLDADGVIVAHVTNKFLDLKPVLASIAESKGLNSVAISHSNKELEIVTQWVLLSPNSNLPNQEIFDSNQRDWRQNEGELVWTDDHASVLPIVRWRYHQK